MSQKGRAAEENDDWSVLGDSSDDEVEIDDPSLQVGSRVVMKNTYLRVYKLKDEFERDGTPIYITNPTTERPMNIANSLDELFGNTPLYVKWRKETDMVDVGLEATNPRAAQLLREDLGDDFGGSKNKFRKKTSRCRGKYSRRGKHSRRT